MRGSVGQRRILFAAGGTGGHIFPALAVKQSLLEMCPDADVRFICGSRPVEMNLYRREGEEPVVLDVQPLRSGVFSRTVGALRLVKGFMDALIFLRRWRPDRILGQGGYVTTPVLMAARLLGIPYDLQEQNTVPGRANLMFAHGAGTVYCSFHEAVRRFSENNGTIRYRYTGMPLRSAVIKRDGMSAEEARRQFGLEPHLPVLFVIGGSQGAKGLYGLVLDALYCLDEGAGSCPVFQCLWSAGEGNIMWLNQELVKRPMREIRISLHPFIKDMGAAYAAATVAISRSGAGSVAELLANGVPTLFVPLPNSAGGHQEYNAREAVQAGAAMCMDEGDLTAEGLAGAIRDLLESESKRILMENASRIFRHQDAAKIIAEDILKKL